MSKRSSKEIHLCDSPLAYGTHDGGNTSSVLLGRGRDFKSCGVAIGMAILNTTQDTDGLITAVTEDSVTDDTNSWNNGDEYEIYFQTKDSFVSSIDVDRKHGRKVYLGDQLNVHGNRPEDEDLDITNDEVWSPGHPEKSHA